MILYRPPVAELTIVHVEDEITFGYLLEPLFQHKGLHYERVSLLSEALEFLEEPGIAGFIFDLNLPQESPSRFVGWGGYEHTPAGLIRRVRRERPDLPIVVLTDFPDDTPLRRLIQDRILRPEDILKKSDQGDESLEALVKRFQKGVTSLFLPQERQPLHAAPPSFPLPANMDLLLLHLVEKARRGLLPGNTSTEPGEIPVLARVNSVEAWRKLRGVRPDIEIPSPGGQEWIVTGYLQAEQAEYVHEQDCVLSLEAAYPLQGQLAETLKEVRADHLPDLLVGSGQPGKGVVMGFVDYGCDFAHPNFRHEEGKGNTRVLALWDQGAASPKGSVKPGALYENPDLNAALASSDPYKHLGYSFGAGSHGTYVMDIAAGGGAGTGVAGIAREADIVFVDLADNGAYWGLQPLEAQLGDSRNLLRAINFIFNYAKDRPCVVNLSLGSQFGPHDGTSTVEDALDDLVKAKPNRAAVVCAYNSHEWSAHASGHVPRDAFCDLKFRVVEEKKYAVLDLWYSSQDQFAAEILSPEGVSYGRVELGTSRRWLNPEGVLETKLVHISEHSYNGDNRIQLFLDNDDMMSSGDWCLRLHGVDVQGGHFHAWLEGGNGPDHSFLPPYENKSYTIGNLGCGNESIVVGAYNTHNGCKLCSFSSAGPTRDGRQKPDLSAPGEGIRAATARSTSQTEAKQGTSFAAPVVAGVVAVLLGEAQTLGIDLTSQDIRDILLESVQADPPDPKRGWNERYGWGRLDARSAILALKKRVPSPSGEGDGEP